MVQFPTFFLKLNPSNTKEIATRKMRKAALKMHPNKGGSTADFQEMMNEYNAFLQFKNSAGTTSRPSPRNHRSPFPDIELSVIGDPSFDTIWVTPVDTIRDIFEKVFNHALRHGKLNIFRGFYVMVVCLRHPQNQRPGLNTVLYKKSFARPTQTQIRNLFPSDSRECHKILVNVFVSLTQRQSNNSRFYVQAFKP